MKFQRLFILLIFIKQITLLNQFGYMSGLTKGQKNCSYIDKIHNNRRQVVIEGENPLNDNSFVCLNGSLEKICEEVQVSPKTTDYYECGITKNCFRIKVQSFEKGLHRVNNVQRIIIDI